MVDSIIEFQKRAPDEAAVTSYDARQFLTYARLLDAEAAGIDWREGAAIILECDVEGDPEAARLCWDSHVARAHWIVREGYAQLRDHAGMDSLDQDSGASR